MYVDPCCGREVAVVVCSCPAVVVVVVVVVLVLWDGKDGRSFEDGACGFRLRLATCRSGDGEVEDMTMTSCTCEGPPELAVLAEVVVVVVVVVVEAIGRISGVRSVR